jgi:AraC family transcriptional regulator
MHEIVCRAGPSDRPFEEQHDGFSVAAVIQGSFTYRSDAGHGLLYPGALLLGNSGSCFECGHAHGVGDRCVSLNVREEQFSEIAAAAASTSRFRFSAPSLPPSPRALRVVAHMEALSCAPSSLRSDELALRIVERVIAAMTGDRQTQSAPTGRETRRVVNAIRLVEADAARRWRRSQA